MDGFEQDTRLIRALVEYAGMKPAVVAREAGVAVTTINRPFTGTATSRLGRAAMEKLRARFPDFPGWADHLSGSIVGDKQQPYRQVDAGLPRGAALPDTISVAGIDLDFGLGAAFMDQEIVESQAQALTFPRSWLRQITDSPASQLYWTRGVGNSMEPTISDGDVILIDRSKVGSTFGDLYWAIAYGQTGMIKRLRPMPDGSVKIISDNPAVPPEIAYDGELHIFGRVIAVVRRL